MTAIAIAVCINTLVKVFYNYVYLDLSKPGKFLYDGMEFSFEPFYVGKGFGNRWKKMCGRNRWLKHKLDKLKNKWKLNDLVSIFNVGQTEEHVLLEEVRLIKKIGRKDLDKGPLLNLTDGGETTAGIIPWNKGKKMMPWSLEIREKMKKRVPWNKGKTGVQVFSLETKEKMKKRVPWNKGKTGVQLVSEVTREKLRQSTIVARKKRFWSTRHKIAIAGTV